MSKTYVLVDVGCIECGESTSVRHVTTSRQKALAAFNAALGELDCSSGSDWDEPDQGCWKSASYFIGGQHSLELHVLRTGKEQQP